MKVLLTNDDGIYAPGLWALHRLFSRDHHVTVVAPDRERSAVSHGITLFQPLRTSLVNVNEGDKGYAVNGKPADCIKLGLTEIMPALPDLVVSGINPGANVAISINYSGTVAAAREAALFGVPSIAVSIDGYDIESYESAAAFTENLGRHAVRSRLPFGTLLNVNVPNIPPDKIKGVRMTRQGMDVLSEEYYEKRVDPRNRAYHWLGSDARIFGEDLEIDSDALCHHYISITPIQCDMTNYSVLNDLYEWNGGKLTASPRQDGQP
jgi:5'-nucleotidase